MAVKASPILPDSSTVRVSVNDAEYYGEAALNPFLCNGIAPRPVQRPTKNEGWAAAEFPRITHLTQLP